MSDLESEGVVKYISPSTLLQEYDEIMTKSVIDDLTDSDFLSMCRQQRHPPWEIYAEKVPSGLADAIFRKYLVNVPSFYAGQSAKKRLREGPYASMDQRRMFYEEMREQGQERERRYRESRCVVLPFEVGESIMINHALCASGRFSLCPLADDSVHHSFLMFKFQKATNTPLLKRILADYGFIKDIKNDLTAVNIISETIPVLENASIPDLLEFRDKNKRAFKRFRIEMGKLATEVEGNFWDSDFYKKIVDVVDSKVKPAIEDVKASTESCKEKLARILKKGAMISPLPIVASVAPGCIPEVALIASASIVALDEYLNSLKRTRQKNGFSYLFDAQKRFLDEA